MNDLNKYDANKNDTHKHDTHKKSLFETSLSTHTWTDWMMMNRRMVAIASACVLVALIGGVWMLQSTNSRKVKDLDTADVLALELQKSPRIFDDKGTSIDADKALSSLKALNDEYTILQPRFDSLIAEEMLLRENSKELDPYAKRSIERLKDLGLTDFADFSEVSRLSGMQSYKEALKAATDLKGRLDQKRKAGASSHQYLLEGFLLLHIATLNQKLGNHEAMLQSIFELKEFLGLTNRAKPLTAEERELASEMLAHLQDRQSSLLEFMQELPKATG